MAYLGLNDLVIWKEYCIKPKIDLTLSSLNNLIVYKFF